MEPAYAPKGQEPFMTIENTRKADHPIAQLFLDRWSPRAFSNEEIPVDTLMTFFEAARWAPSSYNSQPWRFVWARRGTPHFERLHGLLIGGNPGWTANAAALIVIASSETMKVPNKDEPVPSHSHSFDAGSAWMALALQASLSGWYAHGMTGVDWEKTRTELKIPQGFRPECAIAIGKLGDKSTLPDFYQKVETPNGRKPLAESVFEGTFPG